MNGYWSFLALVIAHNEFSFVSFRHVCLLQGVRIAMRDPILWVLFGTNMIAVVSDCLDNVAFNCKSDRQAEGGHCASLASKLAVCLWLFTKSPHLSVSHRWALLLTGCFYCLEQWTRWINQCRFFLRTGIDYLCLTSVCCKSLLPLAGPHSSSNSPRLNTHFLGPLYICGIISSKHPVTTFQHPYSTCLVESISQAAYESQLLCCSVTVSQVSTEAFQWDTCCLAPRLLLSTGK